ncbi:hypothetical protein MMC25_006109 [Agyrium rufum]|nr:hypothetical protein [Agyrium rufum]
MAPPLRHSADSLEPPTDAASAALSIPSRASPLSQDYHTTVDRLSTPGRSLSRSRSSSLFTAPSPTQFRRSSPSPVQHPLPAPRTTAPVAGSHLSPQHLRSDSSAYYTAAWGSPYDLPPSGRIPFGPGGHQYNASGSTVTFDGSPVPSSRLQRATTSITSPTIRRRADLNIESSPFRSLERSLTLGSTRTSEKRSRYGFTQDWLRSNLVRRKDSEKSSWWSDEESEDGGDITVGVDTTETGLPTSQEKRVASRETRAHSSPWTNRTYSSDIDPTQSPPLTPIPAFPRGSGGRFARATPQQMSLLETPQSNASAAKHRSAPSDATLRQEDFDRTANLPENQRMASVSDSLSSLFSRVNSRKGDLAMADIQEKPLPQPPLNRTASEAPVQLQNAPLPTSSSRPNSSEKRRPSFSSSYSFTRPRKRVVWRGKTCSIVLPYEDGIPGISRRTHSGEIKERFTQLQNSGHDLGGFDLLEKSLSDERPSSSGQSRDIFPDPRDVVRDGQQKSFRVSIPDKRKWDEYVEQLKKDKLRALGVSFDDDDDEPPLPPLQQSQTTASSTMSRQLSAQSTGSQVPFARPQSIGPGGTRPSIPLLLGSQPGHSPFGEISPGLSLASQHPMRQGPMHMHRQSMAVRPDQHFSGFQPSRHQHSPSMAPPQSNYFGAPPGFRGPSPVVNGQRPLPRTAKSFTPSLGRTQMPADDYFNKDNSPNRLSPAARGALQNQFPWQDIPPQQQRRPTLSNQRHSMFGAVTSAPPELAERIRISNSHPDIASPIPQPHHRHNVSETLQKEIEDAEYHLEESMRRELEKEDELESALENEKEHSPLMSHGRPSSQFLDHLPLQNGMRPSGSNSDLDTNPSLQISPAMSNIPGKPSFMRGHAPKPSMSRLNVNAQEFVFKPATPASQPNMFSFFGGHTGAAGPPPAEGAQIGLTRDERPTLNSHIAQPSRDMSAPASNLNVTAPAFKPSGVPSQFSASTREFNFSSSGPSFRPDAPAFTPSFAATASAIAPSSTPAANGNPLPPSGIFGGINFAQLAQQAPSAPAKSDKAIPIVWPAEPQDEQEDEFGRIQRDEGRQKRARRFGGDGDDVPRFADIGDAAVRLQVDVGMDKTIEDGEVRELAKEVGREHTDIPASKEEEKNSGESIEIGGSVNETSGPQAGAPGMAEVKMAIGEERGIESPVTHDNRDHNASPMEKATDQLQEMLEHLPSSEAGTDGEESEHSSTHSAAQGENGWRPIDLKDREKEIAPAEDACLDDLPAEKTHLSDIDDVGAEGERPQEQDLTEPLANLPYTSREQVPTAHKKISSSLSATAKPFEFKPLASSIPPAQELPPLAQQSALSSDDASAAAFGQGLNVSKYATDPDEIDTLQDQGEPTVQKSLEPVQTAQEEEVEEEISMANSPADTSESEVEVIKVAKATLRNGDISDNEKQSVITPASLSDQTGEVAELSAEIEKDETPEQNLQELPASESVDPVQSTAESSQESLPLSPRSIASIVSEPNAVLRPQAPVRNLSAASPNNLNEAFQYLPEKDYESVDSAAVHLVQDNPQLSPSFRPGRSSSPVSHIHNLNLDEAPISDWDDAISSGEEAKFTTRAKFFANRKIDDFIGTSVRQHLQPLEQSIIAIQDSLTQISHRSVSRRGRATAAKVEHSDADDEEDDGHQAAFVPRSRSPLRDRKIDKLKASMNEIVANQQDFARANDVSQIAETVTQLREMMLEQQQQQQQQEKTVSKPSSGDGEVKNIKAIVEEAVGRGFRGKSGVITSSHQSATAEKLKLQVAGLESMLKHAEARAEAELKSRLLAEEAIAEHKLMLRAQQAETIQQREAAEEAERSLHAYHEDRQLAAKKSAVLEEAQEDFASKALVLTEKNAALESTLEEYRLSSTQWREEIDEVKDENSDLQRTIQALKSELQESIRGRQTLNFKIEQIQDDLSRATTDVARDHSLWRRKEEEHIAKHDILSARLAAEARTRGKLEMEIERLEAQEKESMKEKSLMEQDWVENQRLTEQVKGLKAEMETKDSEHARIRLEFHQVKELAQLEAERVRDSLNAALESANHQAKLVRDDLEATVARLQTQLAASQEDTIALKARHELMLDEAADSRNEALRQAAQARESALQEHYRFHERAIENLKTEHEANLLRALSDRDLDHARGIKDHQSFQSQSTERLTLAEDKIAHYRDRVLHLEEKLEIAKSAAHAAVQAVQSAKAASVASPSSTGSTTSLGQNHAQKAISSLPEKISPQALRETILVLQEQLQDREARLEALDPDAPLKIKDLTLEVTWLRELLSVRLDDLSEIIAGLTSSTSGRENYDLQRVRDAAIRLRAGLQMEISERERSQGLVAGQSSSLLVAGANADNAAAGLTSSLPAGLVGSLSNLAAASPRLPLAAAAAWGNWRKGQSSLSGSWSDLAYGGSGSGMNSVVQTPSKKPSPLTVGAGSGGMGMNMGIDPLNGGQQGFLNGLLTPPSTSFRPQSAGYLNSNTTADISLKRPLSGYSASAGNNNNNTMRASGRPSLEERLQAKVSGKARNATTQPDVGSSSRDSLQMLGAQPLYHHRGPVTTEPPSTPPLLRKGSYDTDAESGHYSLGRYVNEDEESVTGASGAGAVGDGGGIVMQENVRGGGEVFGS